jgi:RNA polymerase sigma factor (sigma-70 family)
MEKVWKALEKWSCEGRATFYTYLRRSQELAIIDVIRSQRKEINDHRNEVHAEDISEENFASEMDLDSELIRKDQRQLVSDLVRGSGKNAPKIEPIVNVFLNGDVTSLQDVGDVLGESKQTVSNRLKSLRKVFGEHDFGSISDYYVA